MSLREDCQKILTTDVYNLLGQHIKLQKRGFCVSGMSILFFPKIGWKIDFVDLFLQGILADQITEGRFTRSITFLLHMSIGQIVFLKGLSHSRG